MSKFQYWCNLTLKIYIYYFIQINICANRIVLPRLVCQEPGVRPQASGQVVVPEKNSRDYQSRSPSEWSLFLYLLVLSLSFTIAPSLMSECNRVTAECFGAFKLEWIMGSNTESDKILRTPTHPSAIEFWVNYPETFAIRTRLTTSQYWRWT